MFRLKEFGSNLLYNYSLFNVLLFRILMAVILYQPLPPQEEKELKEALQEILGQGKQVKLEQKVCSFICSVYYSTLLLVSQWNSKYSHVCARLILVFLVGLW